jgi:molybdate-binding protein
MESDPVVHRRDANRMEYFWLCDRCSCALTLRLREDGTVVAVQVPEPIRGVPDSVALALMSVDRKKGLVLRRVRFPLPEKLGDGTSKRRGKARIANGI